MEDDFMGDASMEEANANANLEESLTSFLADLDGGPRRSRTLWDSCERDFQLTMYSPFIVSLAAGTLPKMSFAIYNKERNGFRLAISKLYDRAAYLHGAYETRNHATISFCLNKIKKLVNRYIGDVYLRYKWGSSGLSYPDSPHVSDGFRKYIDSLAVLVPESKIEWWSPSSHFRPSSHFDVSDVLAMTIPYIRLYTSIAQKLKRLDSFQIVGDISDISHGDQDSPESHRFKQWVEVYSSQSFESTVNLAENLFNKLKTRNEFKCSMLYRRAFFNEILYLHSHDIFGETIVPFRKHKRGQPLIIVISSNACLKTKFGNESLLGTILEGSPTQVIEDWALISTSYSIERHQILSTITKHKKSKLFDKQGLNNAIMELSEIEERHYGRIFQSGLLCGQNLEEPILNQHTELFFHSFSRRAGEEERKATNKMHVHLISDSWVKDLERSAFLPGDREKIGFHSGYVSPKRRFDLYTLIIGRFPGTGGVPFSVYVGTSLTDLLCMLEAGVGILVGNCDELKRIGSHYGVVFKPLYSSLVEKQKELCQRGCASWNEPGVLYTVETWDEIHGFILGTEESDTVSHIEFCSARIREAVLEN